MQGVDEVFAVIVRCMFRSVSRFLGKDCRRKKRWRNDGVEKKMMMMMMMEGRMWK